MYLYANNVIVIITKFFVSDCVFGLGHVVTVISKNRDQ